MYICICIFKLIRRHFQICLCHVSFFFYFILSRIFWSNVNQLSIQIYYLQLHHPNHLFLQQVDSIGELNFSRLFCFSFWWTLSRWWMSITSEHFRSSYRFSLCNICCCSYRCIYCLVLLEKKTYKTKRNSTNIDNSIYWTTTIVYRCN